MLLKLFIHVRISYPADSQIIGLVRSTEPLPVVTDHLRFAPKSWHFGPRPDWGYLRSEWHSGWNGDLSDHDLGDCSGLV